MFNEFRIYTEEELTSEIAEFLKTSVEDLSDLSPLELITNSVMCMFSQGSYGFEELEYNLRRHVTRTLSGYPLLFERDDNDYYLH